MTRREWLAPCIAGAASALLAAGLCATRPAFTAPAERAGYDALARAVPLRPASGRIVIVDVDEASLAAIGQWPWSRATMAQLIDNVRRLGAAAIALDVMFAEPQRDAAAASSADAVLTESVARGAVVLGYAWRFDPGAAASPPCLATPPGVQHIERGDASGGRLFEAHGAICNVPMIQAATSLAGYLNAAPDSDGILRRVPLFVGYQGVAYPSLALAAVQHALAVPSTTLVTGHPQAATVRLAQHGLDAPTRHIALDGTANLLVRYRGRKQSLQYVSAVDVLEQRLAPDLLRGHIAFLGTTALGTREVVATPLDTLFTGVEVQATVADNLLQGDYFRRSEHATTIEVLACLLASMLVVPLFHQGRPIAAFALCVGVLGGLWGSALWALSTWSIVLSPVCATGGVILAMASAGASAATQARRRAQHANAAAETSQHLMIETLLSLTEIKDAHTGQHSRRIEMYTRRLAHELRQDGERGRGLSAANVDLLARLSVLHDIGKVGVPKAILNKPGPLSAEEFEEIKQHPGYGYEVIARAERAVDVAGDYTLELAKQIVHTHHERWDGAGYPQGLEGEQIPLPGRIVAVVDVYDALVSDRPYRKGLRHEEACAIIASGRGTHFDPRVVDAFLTVAPAFAMMAAGTACGVDARLLGPRVGTQPRVRWRAGGRRGMIGG